MLLRLALAQHGRSDPAVLAQALEDGLGLQIYPAFELAQQLVRGRSAPLDVEKCDRQPLDLVGIEATVLGRWPALRAPSEAAMTALRAARSALVAELEKRAPEALDRLGPPAWPDDLEALEKAIGTCVPEEWLAFLQLHDGGSPLDWELDRLVGIEDIWTSLSAMHVTPPALTVHADPGVRAVWWSNGWIPFANRGNGDHLCFDLDPAPGGTSGQIVEYRHDDPQRSLVASSFAAWLASCAEALRSGALVVTEHEDGTFETVMRRETLTGSLASVRVRGEAAADRQGRVDELTRDPGAMACELFAQLRKQRLLVLKPDAFFAVHVFPAMTSVLENALPDEMIAFRLLSALRTLPDVARLEARIEDVVDLIKRIRGGHV